jgi:O-antigen biosynthesis protein WbqV
LERDLEEAVKTNVIGSVNVADAAIATRATTMVMISTDKAIEPVSVLGATKRLAEMYCQACDAAVRETSRTRLVAVRFGNVLASNGSVVPKFKQQIEAGGPVTVTHPGMVRYFMTIREACDLVLVAANHAATFTRNDVSVYVLNMGQPVKIVDLAERMIRLSGLEPHRDVEITFTGVRPGERLHELLFAQNEIHSEIGVPGVAAAKPVYPSLEKLRKWVSDITVATETGNSPALYKILRDAVPNFQNESMHEERPNEIGQVVELREQLKSSR